MTDLLGAKVGLWIEECSGGSCGEREDTLMLMGLMWLVVVLLVVAVILKGWLVYRVGWGASRGVLKRSEFLTGNEVQFFHLLRRAVGPGYVVCPQVGAGALMTIEAGVGERRGWDIRREYGFNVIDYVICEVRTMKPLVLVELDDVTHTVERDLKRSGYLSVSGLPLVRFWSRNKPDEAAIRKALNLKGGGVEARVGEVADLCGESDNQRRKKDVPN